MTEKMSGRGIADVDTTVGCIEATICQMPESLSKNQAQRIMDALESMMQEVKSSIDEDKSESDSEYETETESD